MIKEKQYLEALRTVEQYEKEQKDNQFLIEMEKIQFPLGTKVMSKLNHSVRGEVIDYQIWNGIVQIICKDGDKKTRILSHNAVVE